MVLELAEMAGKRHVLGACDVLIAEEQHLVLQQQRANLRDQRRITRCSREVHVAHFGADRTGEGFDPRR
jgi:hypothetical protein